MKLRGIKRIPAVILTFMMLAACTTAGDTQEPDAGLDPAIWAVSGDSVSEDDVQVPSEAEPAPGDDTVTDIEVKYPQPVY